MHRWLPAQSLNSDDAAAQHQANNCDCQHHQAEIAPAIAGGERAQARACHDKGQGDPIAPAQQGDCGRDDDNQGDDPQQNREEVQHVSYMDNTLNLFNRPVVKVSLRN